MSFTGTVKNEISKQEFNDIEAISELSGIVKNNIYDTNIIKITTENASVARMIFNNFKNIYNISCKITVRKGYNFNKNLIYILEITSRVIDILTDLGLYESKIMTLPSSFIIDDDYLVRAYLRGVFLSTGSINDPKTSRYHLEFLVNELEYANFISNLLNAYYLNSKVIKKDNKYMVYIKESEKIGDFLRIMNATNAILYYEDIRIYRDHKNMTNRLNNCEQANVDKIISTSDKQIENITLIESIEGVDLLDDKMKEVILYRKKYPDASLQELSEIISLETGNIITKSGLHHRFNKIKLLADKIRKNS